MIKHEHVGTIISTLSFVNRQVDIWLNERNNSPTDFSYRKETRLWVYNINSERLKYASWNCHKVGLLKKKLLKLGLTVQNAKTSVLCMIEIR